MPDTIAKVVVLPCDREAAILIGDREGWRWDKVAARAGRFDDDETLQILARHRIAAEAAAIERMQSPVAWCIEQAGEIMAISSGCANTHGDPGGGLQMINSIASDIAINLQMTEPASLRTPTKAPDHG